ncbi:MAG: NINE protein [Bacillota bacterium]|nr:NINE protein [Bacillota bacterium]
MKDKKIGFYLCLLLGYLGIHKYYERQIKQGILYTLTAGLFLIGWIVDCITLYKVAFKMSAEEVIERDRILLEKAKEKELLKGQRRSQAKERAMLKREQYKQDFLAEKNRVAQMKKEKIAFCPKCHSTSLTYVNKRLSIGRAVVGDIVAGVPGAILGGLSSKKGKVKCLNCGHSWKL